MNDYKIQSNINVMGAEVKTFPMGIGEAFENLVKKVPGGFSRNYYGIGECKDGKIIYIAGAEEISPGEAKQLGLDHFEIEKGNYISEEVLDWRTKTDCIKDVFEKMYKDERADRSAPSIEIYLDDKKMLCLVKASSSTGSDSSRLAKSSSEHAER